MLKSAEKIKKENNFENLNEKEKEKEKLDSKFINKKTKRNKNCDSNSKLNNEKNKNEENLNLNLPHGGILAPEDDRRGVTNNEDNEGLKLNKANDQ